MDYMYMCILLVLLLSLLLSYLFLYIQRGQERASLYGTRQKVRISSPVKTFRGNLW